MSARGHEKSYAHKTTHVEGWRANVPLFRAVGTMASILISVMWLTWQGSAWVNDIRTEMREIRNGLTAVTTAMNTKAELRDMEHRFELMCARAPAHQRPWVCGNGFVAPTKAPIPVKAQ